MRCPVCTHSIEESEASGVRLFYCVSCGLHGTSEMNLVRRSRVASHESTPRGIKEYLSDSARRAWRTKLTESRR